MEVMAVARSEFGTLIQVAPLSLETKRPFC